MNKRTCTMPECNRAHRARGLCASHYNQEHAPNRHAKKAVACAVCGTEVLKHSGGNKARKPVCSNECRATLRVDRGPTLCRLPVNHWALWFGKTCAWPRYPTRVCVQCSDSFLPKSTNARYCSPRCRWMWHDRQAGARSQAEIAAEVRSCQRCGDAFQNMSAQRIHCSDLCRDMDATERGAYLHHGWIRPATRRAIYERDGHACWLCGEVVDYTADPKRDDWAPTLDHVTPRSKGGTHDPSNLRTAHRWCNSVRSDNEQHDLFTTAA